MIDCRVGQIGSVEKIDGSNKLYLLTVDIGDGMPRKIVSSIRKYYSVDDLTNKLVCVFVNAQQTEIFGELSEGILLGCGDDSNVKLVEPPLDNQPGDRVYFGENSENEDFEMDQNNRYWNKVVHELRIDENGDAMYKDENVYTDYGNVTAPGMKNCPFK